MEVESVEARLERVLLLFRAATYSDSQEFAVATGPYLLLDLIRTQYSAVSYKHAHYHTERDTALALFLHALARLAAIRSSLGMNLVKPMPEDMVHKIRRHPSFNGRWRESLSLFSQTNLRNMAEQAAAYVQAQDPGMQSWPAQYRATKLTCQIEVLGSLRKIESFLAVSPSLLETLCFSN